MTDEQYEQYKQKKKLTTDLAYYNYGQAEARRDIMRCAYERLQLRGVQLKAENMTHPIDLFEKGYRDYYNNTKGMFL